MKYAIYIGVTIVAAAILIVYLLYATNTVINGKYPTGSISPICNLTLGKYNKTMALQGSIISIAPKSYYEIHLGFPAYVCGYYMHGEVSFSQPTYTTVALANSTAFIKENGDVLIPNTSSAQYGFDRPNTAYQFGSSEGYCEVGMCVPYYNSIGEWVLVFVNPTNNTDNVIIQKTLNVSS